MIVAAAAVLPTLARPVPADAVVADPGLAVRATAGSAATTARRQAVADVKDAVRLRALLELLAEAVAGPMRATPAARIAATLAACGSELPAPAEAVTPTMVAAAAFPALRARAGAVPTAVRPPIPEEAGREVTDEGPSAP